MKLGISSYTFPWAIGLPDATPSQPLKPLQLLERAQALGVGMVQFGPNMPLDKLPERELRDLVKQANSWKIDLEVATEGIDPGRVREQIKLAKRIDAILLKTTPEHPVGQIPMRTEISNCLRAIAGDLASEKISLAIDNSRIPAQELNELLGAIRSPWLGAAIDTANPLALPQGWQISVRVLGHRTLSLQIKDVVVEREVHGMGFSVRGCPVGKGQLNIAWIVESFASLRIEPSAILESWTPMQKTLQETIDLEAAWAKQGVDYLRRFIPE
ncbi:MAG: TIM barrel protein [Terriglobia bacterium]|jgi:sugar phosphate isomerase/epimerase